MPRNISPKILVLVLLVLVFSRFLCLFINSLIKYSSVTFIPVKYMLYYLFLASAIIVALGQLRCYKIERLLLFDIFLLVLEFSWR